MKLKKKCSLFKRRTFITASLDFYLLLCINLRVKVQLYFDFQLCSHLSPMTYAQSKLRVVAETLKMKSSLNLWEKLRTSADHHPSARHTHTHSPPPAALRKCHWQWHWLTQRRVSRDPTVLVLCSLCATTYSLVQTPVCSLQTSVFSLQSSICSLL